MSPYRKQCVSSRRYSGGVGTCAQAKPWGRAQGRQPQRNAEFLLHVLKNADSNTELKGLDGDCLVLEPIQVNTAPKMHCRTCRAGRWINPYTSSPGRAEMRGSSPKKSSLTQKRSLHRRHQINETSWSGSKSSIK